MRNKSLTWGSRRFLATITIGLILAQAAWAGPQYKVLHAFGAGTDGGGLWTSVSFDKKGNLYGATSGGGAYGYGVIFKLTRRADGTWTETTLHSFSNGDPNGSEPNGGLIQDGLGNWYGTTHLGGAHDYGTVFQLTHRSGSWAELAVYKFGTQSGDGGEPTAGLVMDKAGNLYGTGPYGGAYNGGTVFELTPSAGGWDETVLYSFCPNTNCADGHTPFAGLILDASGNLYGTTYTGGAHKVDGTVYQLMPTPTGWKEKVLHSFAVNYKDGHTPGWGALLMDGSGNLYGTTAGGGCCGGIVFRLTPGPDGGWKETILYGFKGGAAGFEPNAGVVMDKAGNLYGTTDYGGSAFGCGVIYKLAPRPTGSWKYTVLHIFEGSDGCIPEGNLVLDKAGNLSGGTVLGGTTGNGVIFELTP